MSPFLFLHDIYCVKSIVFSLSSYTMLKFCMWHIYLISSAGISHDLIIQDTCIDHFFSRDISWPNYIGLVRQSGSIPQVVGSIPGRDEFPLTGKKTPSPASCPKHCGAQPNSQGDGPRVRVGQGFGGFLGLVWEGLLPFKQSRGGGLTPRRSNFFLIYRTYV